LHEEMIITLTGALVQL